MRAGWQRNHFSPTDNLSVTYGSVSGGFSFRLLRNSDRVVIYGLMEGEIGGGKALKSDFRVGMGPKIGMIAEPINHWRILFAAGYSKAVLGDERDAFSVGMDQSLSLSTDTAVVIGLKQWLLPDKSSSGTFGLTYYY